MTTRPIQLESLAGQPGLRHGFFTREGGVSEGLYASLNCGYGAKEDRPDAVTENRRRALAAFDLSPASLVTVYQIHSARVVLVDKDEAWAPNENPEADGLVTNRRGVALGILTADCVPVLFADAEAGIIGAAHAGWKGAFSGIAEATVEAMVGLGARRSEIRAAIGPAIQQDSYEVDSQFRAHFLARDAELARFFLPGARAGHHQFDLPGFVEARLKTLEIGPISRATEDTKSDEARFFSYRRATLKGEPDYGRQLSAIALV